MHELRYAHLPNDMAEQLKEGNWTHTVRFECKLRTAGRSELVNNLSMRQINEMVTDPLSLGLKFNRDGLQKRQTVLERTTHGQTSILRTTSSKGWWHAARPSLSTT